MIKLFLLIRENLKFLKSMTFLMSYDFLHNFLIIFNNFLLNAQSFRN